MAIEICIPSGRDEWLALRKKTIGGSEAAALLGAHPYKTLAELWAEKSGLVDAIGETPAMRRGRHLESVAIEFLREEQPSWRIFANAIPGGKFYRDPVAGLSCTPDAFVQDSDREGFGIAQIKSVAPLVFKNKWRTEDGTIEPPLYAIIQAIVEAHMTGASWACVAPLIVDHGIELHLVDVPIHAELLDRLTAEAKLFWQHVHEGRPPNYDFSRDGALLAKLYAGETGEIISLSGINDLPELVAEDQALKARIEIDTNRRIEIKNRFKAEMKDASVATYNGNVIATRKIVNVKGHTVKPHQHARITLKETTR